MQSKINKFIKKKKKTWGTQHTAPSEVQRKEANVKMPYEVLTAWINCSTYSNNAAATPAAASGARVPRIRVQRRVRSPPPEEVVSPVNRNLLWFLRIFSLYLVQHHEPWPPPPQDPRSALAVLQALPRRREKARREEKKLNGLLCIAEWGLQLRLPPLQDECRKEKEIHEAGTAATPAGRKPCTSCEMPFFIWKSSFYAGAGLP